MTILDWGAAIFQGHKYLDNGGKFYWRISESSELKQHAGSKANVLREASFFCFVHFFFKFIWCGQWQKGKDSLRPFCLILTKKVFIQHMKWNIKMNYNVPLATSVWICVCVCVWIFSEEPLNITTFKSFSF